MLVENPEKEIKIKLILEDGSVFEGWSFGAKKSVAGEVVFNTGMVGYPESMTDPSYKGQILVLTYPLVGNYGVPSGKEKEDNMLKFFESDKIQIEGLIVSDYSHIHNHWNSAKSLADWLIQNDKPAIYGIDTRALTKKLREKGTMLGKIVYYADVEFEDPDKRNLVSEVSIREPVVYGSGKRTIMVVDCGIKNSIIRSFLKKGVRVVRVPWNYPFHSSEYEYDGLFISNGPGNPKMCVQTIENLRIAMGKNNVIFGICLGNQLLALAAGADTYKLKYGHRSQNQPCAEEGTKRCYITPQNHGFAVKTESLPEGWLPWFTNANDGTNEGIRHVKKPWMSVQFHPEAACGPVDTEFLFDKFLEMVEKNAGN